MFQISKWYKGTYFKSIYSFKFEPPALIKLLYKLHQNIPWIFLSLCSQNISIWKSWFLKQPFSNMKVWGLKCLGFKNNFREIYLEARWSQKILKQSRLLIAMTRWQWNSLYMADTKSLLNCGHLPKLATKPFIIYILSSSHLFSQDHNIVFLCPAAPSYLLLLKSANVPCNQIYQGIYVKHCEGYCKWCKESLREEREKGGKKSQLKYGLGKGLDKKKINGVKIIFTVWLPLPATL